jgi:hypothetical protein
VVQADEMERKNPHRFNGELRDWALEEWMKLEQGQIWKQGDNYLRIVEWGRMHIEYKIMKDPATKEGSFHQVTKKEFCRMLKGAVLQKLEKPTAAAAELSPVLSPETV